MEQKFNCILLIDDDEPTNYLNKMILNEMKVACHIKAVQSGEEAISIFQESEKKGKEPGRCHPDLVFVDLNMPAMNGWEFIDLYKKEVRNRKAAMVILTTSLNPEDEQQAHQIDEVCYYANKPLTQTLMQQILNECFGDRV